MINIPTLVDTALRTAGIPYESISFGDLANRATWTVQFLPAATPAHRAAAVTLLATVAIDATAQAGQDQKEAQAFVDGMPIWAKALALAIIDQLNVLRAGLPAPLPPITPAQAIAAIRAKAGTL